jgi:hypothetical protein
MLEISSRIDVVPVQKNRQHWRAAIIEMEAVLHLSVRSYFVFLILLSVVASARAQEIDQLKMVMNSKICPGNLATVDILNATAICNPDRSVTRQCDVNYSPGGQSWAECYDKVQRCSADVSQQNQTIYAYNAFIYKCRVAFPDRPGKTTAVAVSPTRSEYEAQRSQVDDARKAAQNAVKQEEVRISEQEAEKSRLKAAPEPVTAACRRLVTDCQKQTSNLMYLSEETERQCTESCRVLQIENCNTASDTVRGSRQMCTNAAKQDYAVALDNWRREIEERREAQRQQRAREQAGEMALEFLNGFANGLAAGANGGSSYQSPSRTYSAPVTNSQSSGSISSGTVQRPTPSTTYTPPPPAAFVPSKPSCSQTTGRTCTVQ